MKDRIILFVCHYVFRSQNLHPLYVYDDKMNVH